jgi:beta-galactosidase
MTLAEEVFYRDFFAQVCRQAGVMPILPDVSLPACVEVSERSGGGQRFIFLLNHSAQPVELALPQPFADVLHETPPSASVTLAPFGVAVLS